MQSERARAAAETVFPQRTIVSIEDLNRGRGVFSEVVRVVFDPTTTEPNQPPSVAVKLAVDGPNGDAARRSGGYDREALAYRSLLPHLTVSVPHCFGVIDDPRGATFVLEDLSDRRAVDQLDGLDTDDAVAVASTLGTLHRSPAFDSTEGASIRHNTVAGLDPSALGLGLAALHDRWRAHVGSEAIGAFERLVADHAGASRRFAAAGPIVLCHGDPRADNLVFGATPILFDWQQIARQPGVGDLAWLAATSLEPEVRRLAEPTMLDAYRSASGVAVGHDDYRAAFALPGLAVLYLAQREATDDRTSAFIGTSLRRIGQALVDLEVDRP